MASFLAPEAAAELATLRSAMRPIAHALAASGHSLYFVGGVVRDLVLHDRSAPPSESDLFHDVDLTTSARPKEIKRVLQPLADALWTQGERFGTVGAHLGGRAFEITTHRAESYDPMSRKPQVAFGDDLDTDLSRRDFTINAMAIEVGSGVLHDPFGGADDLAQHRLRTPLDPTISFTDDPLRMLRAARFIPRFELDAAPELIEAATSEGPRLAIVSRERIHDELERLFAVDDPARGFAFLVSTHLLRLVVPGLGNDEAMAVERAIAQSSPLGRRAGMLTPLGSTGAGTWLSEMRYSSNHRATTTAILRRWEEFEGEQPDAWLRRSALSLDPDELDAAVRLVTTTSATGADLSDRFRAMESEQTLMIDRKLVEGGEVMELLDLRPGPEVGKVLTWLVEQQIIGGPLSRADALDLVRTYPSGPEGL